MKQMISNNNKASSMRENTEGWYRTENQHVDPGWGSRNILMSCGRRLFGSGMRISRYYISWIICQIHMIKLFKKMFSLEKKLQNLDKWYVTCNYIVHVFPWVPLKMFLVALTLLIPQTNQLQQVLWTRPSYFSISSNFHLQLFSLICVEVQLK